MKILSWNLYNLYDAKEMVNLGFFKDLNTAQNYVDRRVQYYIKEIKNIVPDMCLFYEVFSEEVLRRIMFGVYGENYFYFGTKPDRRGIFNVLVSKTKQNCEELFLTDLEIPLFDINEKSLTNKYLVQKRGYIKLDLGDTNLYAVHLKSQLPSNIKTGDGEDYEPKNSIDASRAQILGELNGLAEAYSLRKIFSNDILNENKNVIVVGDCNADTKNKRMRVIRGNYFNKEKQEPFKDELLDIFGDEYGSSFSYVFKGEKVRLDHLLVNKNLIDRVTNFEIIENLISNKNDDVWHDINVLGSDHAPIMFEFN